MDNKDILIIGAGISGLTAAIYLQRAGRHVVVFEKSIPGGQIVSAAKVDNFPGNPGMNGADFAMRLYQQAMDLGAEFVNEEVIKIERADGELTVYTAGRSFRGSALIIATGAEHRRTGLPKEEDLIGKGVAFCASCDGAFYKDKTVAVYGGGNTALGDAEFLSRIASRVYLIHRRDGFKADRILTDMIRDIPNIIPVMDTTVVGLKGGDRLEALEVMDNKTGEIRDIPTDGLFVAIGMKPDTELYRGIVELDGNGYIVASDDTRTSVPNIYAAGDCRTKLIRQLTTASADGTTAAILASREN